MLVSHAVFGLSSAARALCMSWPCTEAVCGPRNACCMRAGLGRVQKVASPCLHGRFAGAVFLLTFTAKLFFIQKGPGA